ncbi:hypothetical protein DN752_01355 [Echinicola strongylocentroti]|uniref:Uncharacterized protein n=2 Tax=Echinicola strongylocentroti TaxID=1795355 RepID=A0A2Z4IDD8_9BACT|nr:hypothetical protein DN752_01355 [Echinicola strongylocentroti]
MNIQAEKKALIKRLEQINDRSLIEALKHMVDFGLREMETRISVEQYNRELDEAEAEMDRGEYISHEDLKAQMKKW